MITQTEKTATVAANADFTRLVTEYKALLTAQELPFSIDVDMLRTTVRTQLFQKLLGVDKGLKMRFDMLKSQEARIKLVTDTIDLTGYDAVDAIAEGVKGLETAYNRIFVSGFFARASSVVPFAQFAEVYALDLAAMLDARTFDWAGKEHVLEYFQQLGNKLGQLRTIMQAGVGTHYTLADVLSVLRRFYTDQSSQGEVIAHEGAVMRLYTDLNKAGKLAVIPSGK